MVWSKIKLWSVYIKQYLILSPNKNNKAVILELSFLVWGNMLVHWGSITLCTICLAFFDMTAVWTVTDAGLESLVKFYWITEFFSLQMSVLNLFKSRQETTAKKKKKCGCWCKPEHHFLGKSSLSFNLFNLSLFLCSVSPSCLCLCAIISVCLCMCL